MTVKEKVQRIRGGEQKAPPRETTIWVKDKVATATTGYMTGGIRVDAKRLSTDEQHELVTLIREISTDEGGVNMTKLGDKSERFELLVEKGAGKKPGEIFQAARDLDELRKIGSELRRESRKPPRRPKLEEEGSVTLKRQWVFDYVRDGVLWPTHMTVLLYVMTIFENGDVPLPWKAVTYDGDAIRIDLRQGHFLPDPTGAFAKPERLLDHLETNSFIELTKTGRVLLVRPGSRLRKLRAAA
jgi:hypothetical protein